MLESAFPIVVFAAVALSVVMSLVFLFSRGSLYDQIGDTSFATEHNDPSAELPPPAPGSAADLAEQELEIRQMLRARSERMVGRGEPALDIDAEVARLLGGANPVAPAGAAPARGHDAGIEREVRQLVNARNERRARQGLEPLDVDAEVTRTLNELSP